MSEYTYDGDNQVPAYEGFVNESTYWLVWCDHCRDWHRHGPMNGHREAHCTDESSPYWKNGYNIAYAGRWTDLQGASGRSAAFQVAGRSA